MYPKIIGLVGRSRVGKDTVAEYIIEQFNEYKIERLSNPLKKAVCNLYNFTSEQVESNQKEEIDKRYGFTPREAIVSLTNYMMSIMDVDHFTKLLYNKYEDPFENHIYFYARTQLVLFINDGWEEGTKFCKEYQLDNINPKLVPWYNPDVYEIKIN